MVRWLDMLVLTLFARDLAEAAAFVALAFLVRMAPRLLFGMFVGALADRFNRKKIWIASLLILSVMYFALTAYVMLEGIDFWLLLGFVFIAGTVWSVEFPTRRAMIADVVAPHQVGRAVGLGLVNRLDRTHSGASDRRGIAAGVGRRVGLPVHRLRVHRFGDDRHDAELPSALTPRVGQRVRRGREADVARHPGRI